MFFGSGEAPVSLWESMGTIKKGLEKISEVKKSREEELHSKCPVSPFQLSSLAVQKRSFLKQRNCGRERLETKPNKDHTHELHCHFSRQPKKNYTYSSSPAFKIVNVTVGATS